MATVFQTQPGIFVAKIVKDNKFLSINFLRHLSCSIGYQVNEVNLKNHFISHWWQARRMNWFVKELIGLYEFLKWFKVKNLKFFYLINLILLIYPIIVDFCPLKKILHFLRLYKTTFNSDLQKYAIVFHIFSRIQKLSLAVIFILHVS